MVDFRQDEYNGKQKERNFKLLLSVPVILITDQLRGESLRN
jgi:hypothetical protein